MNDIQQPVLNEIREAGQEAHCREIRERVGLHLSAVGNAVQRVANNPTHTMAQAVKELAVRFKNQES